MKHQLTIVAVVLFFAADLAALIVLFRDPDPRYRIGSWFALGRYDRFNAEIATAAARESLDPTLVKAVVWKSSAFEPKWIGTTGERGLMQLGDGLGTDWAAAHKLEGFMHTDLFDSATNLRAGCWHLRRVLDRWSTREDPVPFALAEYAAGPEAATRWAAGALAPAAFIARIDSPETHSFVVRVLARKNYYAAGGK